MTHYKLYFDGSCGPRNPGGTAAYGYALFREGQEGPVDSGSGVIGSGEGMTNNLAEFYALNKGLSVFWNRWDKVGSTRLSVYGDSQFVINIMTRHWKPRADKAYFRTYERVLDALKDIRKNGVSVTFDWIPREMNQVCDDLSKVHQKKLSEKA